MSSAWRIQVTVLGMFALTIDGAPVELPPQAQRVLAHLTVLQAGQPRTVLAGRLWGDLPQPRAMAVLRTALWRLRKVDNALVSASRDRVSLGPGVWTDLGYAQRCAADIGSAQREARWTYLIELLDTDLLIGWEDDWLPIERERQRQSRVHALESLAESLVQQGQHGQAIQAALAAVRAEPLRETAQAVLIRAHLSEGNTSEAVRQFESYRRLLGEELGLRPSPRIRSLLYQPAAG